MKISIQQKQQIAQIVKKYDLDFVVFFGSQLEGNTHKESDLDIAVKGSRTDNYKRFGEIFNAFSEVFLGANVDLRFIKNAEPVFLYELFMKGQFLGGDIQDFLNYKAFAYKNYIDSSPLLELKKRLLKKRQKKLNKLAYA